MDVRTQLPEVVSPTGSRAASKPEMGSGGASIAPPRMEPIEGRRRARLARAARALQVSWLPAVLDLAAIAAACQLAVGPDERLTWLFPLVAIAVLYARRAYAARLRTDLLASLATVASALSIAAMVLLVLESVAGEAGESAVLVRVWLSSLVGVVVLRAVVQQLELAARRARLVARRTLVVGAGEVGARVCRRLLAMPEFGLEPVGFIDADPPPAERVGGRPAPILGDLATLERSIGDRGVDHVLVAFSSATDRELLPLMRTCAHRGVSVSLVPRFFDSINGQVCHESVGGLPVLTFGLTNPDGWKFAVKHAGDRVLAAALLLALGPLLLLIAAGVKLSSPGPVLFRQVRVGRDGRAFEMLKFRTMRPAASQPAFAPRPGLAPGGVEGVDRRTRIGRWLRRTSLDELPQLLNVLRGQMSLVGPRPERPEFVDVFVGDHVRYGERHRVRAGLTGLSQISNLRGQCSLADRVELDNYYIENFSLRLDLKILVYTLVAIVRAAE